MQVLPVKASICALDILAFTGDAYTSEYGIYHFSIFRASGVFGVQVCTVRPGRRGFTLPFASRRRKSWCLKKREKGKEFGAKRIISAFQKWSAILHNALCRENVRNVLENIV